MSSSKAVVSLLSSSLFFISLTCFLSPYRAQDPARAAFEIDLGPRSTGSAADVAGPHGLNEMLYPMDSLQNPGSIFPFADKLPSSRVHHAMNLGTRSSSLVEDSGQSGDSFE